MKQLVYSVRFNTPAFLGNAEQQAQWRTPPFKALIRQWWRVARGITDVGRLREQEGQLFGSANDEGGGGRKSRVRIRLDNWHQPQIGNLENAGSVCHPEVDNPRLRNCPDGDGGGKLVDAGQYLGYGPFQKPNAAIQAGGEYNALCLALPDNEPSVADALQLIHWFGTLGGRSRNGWGSLELLPLPRGCRRVGAASESRGEGASLAPLEAAHPLLRRVASPLADCLRHDWPHALGQSADGRLLLWQSIQPFTTWREAMQALAKAKIGFRTALNFRQRETQNRTRPVDIPFNDRHLLAYPVTHHAVAAWADKSDHGRLKYDRQGWVVQSTRLANQLRFKVAKNAEGTLVARIFHLPCALPRDLAHALGHSAPTPAQQAAIWQTVHDWLDHSPAFRRI